MAQPDLHEHQFELGSDICTVPGCTQKVDEDHLEQIEQAAPPQTKDVCVLGDDDGAALMIYLLIRDHMTMGAFEAVLAHVQQSQGGDTVSNPHLIEYARSAIARLSEA